jgi:putative addiction module component (TIGR02574 family)
MIKIEEILDMSVAERILMIERIWDSIDGPSVDISAGQEQELDRRLARYEKGETKFFTCEEIKTELNSDK